MTQPERRRYPRFKVQVPVQVQAGGGRLEGMLKDLCRDAVLVETASALDLGSAVSLTAELPGTGGPVHMVGRVVRLAAGAGGRHDLAILFTSVSTAAEARIDDFIALQAT